MNLLTYVGQVTHFGTTCTSMKVSCEKQQEADKVSTIWGYCRIVVYDNAGLTQYVRAANISKNVALIIDFDTI